MVVTPELLSGLNAEQLRELARDLIAQVASRDQTISAREQQIDAHNLHIDTLDQQITNLDQAITAKDREILYRQAKIDQLTHEMAVLKRWKFGRSREQLDAGQASLLDETIDADIAAIGQELQDLATPDTAAKEPRQQPKRAALPPELPRVELHHEPDSTTCACGCGCGCQLKRIGCHRSWRVHCAILVCIDTQHGADTRTGQFAVPCKSARPRGFRGACPQSPSRLESAVELRLGIKSAG
jgi:hypothetical protein